MPWRSLTPYLSPFEKPSEDLTFDTLGRIILDGLHNVSHSSRGKPRLALFVTYISDEERLVQEVVDAARRMMPLQKSTLLVSNEETALRSTGGHYEQSGGDLPCGS
jgi:hypothetical protein